MVTYMDSHGSFEYWIKDALDKKRWAWMIESKLVHPDRDIPEPSQDEEPTSRPRRAPRSPPRARPRRELEETDNNLHHHTNLHPLEQDSKLTMKVE